MSRAVARLSWIVPVLLMALSAQQFMVARSIGETLRSGEEAEAQVLRYFRSDRKDVTHAEVDLKVRLSDGTERTWEHVALLYTIAHRIDEAESVMVRVRAGASPEVVLTAIGGTQKRIALSNGAMSLIVFLIALAGVWSWNRYVSRQPVEPVPGA
jgi:Zn-dependent protease with chaperone function